MLVLDHVLPEAAHVNCSLPSERKNSRLQGESVQSITYLKSSKHLIQGSWIHIGCWHQPAHKYNTRCGHNRKFKMGPAQNIQLMDVIKQHFWCCGHRKNNTTVKSYLGCIFYVFSPTCWQHNSQNCKTPQVFASYGLYHGFARFRCKVDAQTITDASKHTPALFWRSPGPENKDPGPENKV